MVLFDLNIKCILVGAKQPGCVVSKILRDTSSVHVGLFLALTDIFSNRCIFNIDGYLSNQNVDNPRRQSEEEKVKANPKTSIKRYISYKSNLKLATYTYYVECRVGIKMIHYCLFLNIYNFIWN